MYMPFNLTNSLLNPLSIMNISLFDRICISIIIICIILCLLIYNQHNLKRLSTVKRNSIFAGSFIFVLAFLFLFTNPTEASSSVEEIKTISSNGLFETYQSNEISKLSPNKIIVVGDSRMEYIETNDDVEVPNNLEFIAKSGARFSWFDEEAREELIEALEEDNNYVYHVVFNMGVNDINYSDNLNLIAKDYYMAYYELAKEYPNVYFYMLSINPIDEDLINEHFSTNTRTNAKIENVNSTMIKYMKENNLSNMAYCDSYHKVTFGTPDGLHYDTDTDQRIIDFIINDCIDYQ